MLPWIIAVFVVLPMSLEAQDNIHLLFTSNSNGKYENCRCPEYPYGALERRAQFIAEYMAQYPEAIVLDNGDNFLHGMRAEEKTLVARIFSLIPYDIINVGDQDMAFGSDPFMEMTVSHPVTRPATISRQNADISVLPVFHPGTTKFYPEGFFKDVEMPDPEQSIQRWLRRSSGMIQILLSHSGYDQDVKFAEQYPEIDLIIGGHSQTVIDTLHSINGVLVQQAGGNAEYVGEIVFRISDKNLTPVFYKLHPMEDSIETHPQVKAWLKELHSPEN